MLLEKHPLVLAGKVITLLDPWSLGLNCNNSSPFTMVSENMSAFTSSTLSELVGNNEPPAVAVSNDVSDHHIVLVQQFHRRHKAKEFLELT
jgi:hypothetical protein